MTAKRILLVRDRDFFFHVHQLAGLLARNGHDVEVLQTQDAAPEPLYRDLIDKTQRLGIKCHVVQGRASWIERRLMAIALRCRLIAKLSVIAPHKIIASKRAIAGKSYDFIIAFDPPALFLACKLFPNELDKIINYSIEAIDESEWQFQRDRVMRSFRYFERRIQLRLYALMIQDRFRASLILRHCASSHTIKTIFFPVAMSGPMTRRMSEPLTGAGTAARAHPQAKIVFFGGLWSEDLVAELEAVSRQLGPGQVLVIHGGRGSIRPREITTEKFVVSTALIPFDDVNELIASADVGLALYPDRTSNNTRYTAFASEKIARYTQCGIPFIAFHNEDFEFLRAETGCCELIREYSEIPNAINAILANYDSYRRGAIAAFHRFYCLDVAGASLLREISASD
jgi:hypothetical protein